MLFRSLRVLFRSSKGVNSLFKGAVSLINGAISLLKGVISILESVLDSDPVVSWIRVVKKNRDNLHTNEPKLYLLNA